MNDFLFDTRLIHVRLKKMKLCLSTIFDLKLT